MAKLKQKNPFEGNGQTLALSLLTAGEMAHSWSAFLPSRFTVRALVLSGDGKQEKNIKDLRSGYIPALTFGLALGGVVSYIAKSPLPFLFSAATGAIMLVLYEQGLPKEMQLHNCLMNGKSLYGNQSFG